MHAPFSFPAGLLVLPFLLLLQPLETITAKVTANLIQLSDARRSPPDADQDKIEDAEELWLVKTFAPVYEYDDEEHNIFTGHQPISEGKDVAYYYQVTPGYACSKSAKSITPKSPTDYTILTIVAVYPYDYVPFDPPGFDERDVFAHNGDGEKIQICMLKYYDQPANWSKMHGAVYTRVESKKKIWYRPEMVFVNRHGNDPVMYADSELKWETSSGTNFRLYISEGKHATFKSKSECENSVDGYWGAEKLSWKEDCGGYAIRPTQLQSAKNNVGEGKKPLITKISNAFGNGRTEYVWGTKQRFCGGKNTSSPDRKRDVISIDLWATELGYKAEYCASSLATKWLGAGRFYEINIGTGDVDNAGTGANVYIDVYGKNGEARYIYLDDPNKDDFERDAYDTFEVEMPDLGKIVSVCVYHDNTNSDAGWNLDWVYFGFSEELFEFNQQWLATSSSPKRLWACRPTDKWPSGVWLPK